MLKYLLPLLIAAGVALAQSPPAPSDLMIVTQRAQMFEAQAAYLQSMLITREHQWAEYSRPLWAGETTTSEKEK